MYWGGLTFPVRLISIRQLLLQQALLVLTHSLKCLSILLVQLVIAESQRKADEDLTGQGDHDADLAANIARCLRCSESLRAEDVADTEGNHSHGVGHDFLTVACQIGSVPGKEEHEDLFGNVSATLGEGDFEVGDVRH
jgi:hypothetical protein